MTFKPEYISVYTLLHGGRETVETVTVPVKNLLPNLVQVEDQQINV